MLNHATTLVPNTISWSHLLITVILLSLIVCACVCGCNLCVCLCACHTGSWGELYPRILWSLGCVWQWIAVHREVHWTSSSHWGAAAGWVGRSGCLSMCLSVCLPGYMSVRGYASHAVGFNLSGGLHLGRSEMLRSLKHYLWAQSQGHYTIDHLEENTKYRRV